MKVGRTLYVTTSKVWRAWLRRNHAKVPDVWLVYWRKETGKPRIAYNDAVDEALCFGWIDSTVKGLGGGAFAQRFSPRRPGSNWSAMNHARMRRLIRERRMTKAGRAVYHTTQGQKTRHVRLAPDVERALRKDPFTWKNFKKLPNTYTQIRLGWIEAARKRKPAFRTRLKYFIKMTRANKRFGMVQG